MLLCLAESQIGWLMFCCSCLEYAADCEWSDPICFSLMLWMSQLTAMKFIFNSFRPGNIQHASRLEFWKWTCFATSDFIYRLMRQFDSELKKLNLLCGWTQGFQFGMKYCKCAHLAPEQCIYSTGHPPVCAIYQPQSCINKCIFILSYCEIK